jgi:flagellar protein FliO/FliZ
MFPSLDQLLDPLTLLVVGAIVIAVAVGVLVGRASKRVRRAESPSRQGRLAIVESLDLDPKRRLVILRRDEVEHLVLLGGPSDLVVEADIERPADRRLAELPAARAARPEPEDWRPARIPPVHGAEPDLVRTAIAREPEASETTGARRESPRAPSAAARAATSPLPGGARAISPVPPEPAAGRPTPYRAPATPRTRLTPTADSPRVELPATRRSVATPVHRSTPPSPVPLGHDELGSKRSKLMNVIDSKVLERDASGEPDSTFPHPALEPELLSSPDSTTDAGARHDGTQAPAPDELAVVDPIPQEEASPAPEGAQALPDAATDDTTAGDVLDEPGVASGGPDPIDRLEAEIARLLGRAPADHESR